MPNAYATLEEIRAGIPNALRTESRQLDPLFLDVAAAVSRAVDDYTGRVYIPRLEIRRFDSWGGCVLKLPDFVSVSLVEYSNDDGATYTTLAASNYIAATGDDYNARASYDRLVIDVNGTMLSYWPTGQRAMRITAVWAYAEERDDAWQLTGSTVQDNPLSSSATALTVSDLEAKDPFALTPRIMAGQILRIESEYVETTPTGNTGVDTIGIVRGRNGTTAAAHVQNTDIYRWQVVPIVKRACIVQSVRHVMRGLQGFGDARANPEIGELIFTRQLDPEVIAMLAPLRKLEFA